MSSRGILVPSSSPSERQIRTFMSRDERPDRSECARVEVASRLGT
jgi:hypothetical protein